MVSAVSSGGWCPTFTLPAPEDVFDRIEGVWDRISSCECGRVLRPVKAAAGGFGRVLKALIMKVVELVRRHPTVFKAYLLMGAALLFAGVSWSTMLVNTVPGAWYILSFQQGDSLPTDWVSRVDVDESPDYWLPSVPGETESDAMRGRLRTLNRLVSQVPYGNFFAITGESRIGKSESLKWVAQRLVADGHPVYEFHVKKFLDNQFGGNESRRFQMLLDHLKDVQDRTGKRPILVADEYTDTMQATHLEHCFKNPGESFALLTAMTRGEFENLQSSDASHANRFDLGVYSIEPLDQTAIVEILKNSAPTRLDCRFNEGAIEFAVERTVAHSQDRSHLVLSRAFQILERARRYSEDDLVSREEIRAIIHELPGDWGNDNR